MNLVLGDYIKMLFGEGDYPGGGFSNHLQGFLQTVGLGKEVGQSVHGGGNKQNERNGNIFGKMGNTRGIIQGDNSAGHCFVL